MTYKTFKKLAAIGVIALGIASYSTPSMAQTVGAPETIAVSATVNNTIAVATTPLDFGTIGAIKDPLDQATFTVDAATSAATNDPGDGYLGTNPAAIVGDIDNPPAAATVSVTAFKDVDLYVTYDNCVNPFNGAETFELILVQDDLTTPGSTDCTTPTIGMGHTDPGTGVLAFNIGGAIRTEIGAYAPYGNGAYAGSFDATFSY